MKTGILKKTAFVLLCAAVMAAAFPQIICKAQNDRVALSNYYSDNTVRVGWFTQSGFQYITPNGNRNGYCYDLYRQIGRYSDITYEYVDDSFVNCLERLKPGNDNGIDVLAGVAYNAEGTDLYDYSSMSIGTLCCSLVTTAGNREKYAEIDKLDGARIAVADSRYVSNEGRLIIASAGVKCEFLECSGFDACEKMLKNGDADLAIISNFQVVDNELSVVYQFAPLPLYFAVSKGDSELLNIINNALEDIVSMNPGFTDALYQKYYSYNKVDNFILRDAEHAAISGKKTINVYLDKKSGYLNDMITDEVFGIMHDYVMKAADLLGVEVKFVTSEDGGINKLLSEGRLDIVPGFFYDYSWASDCGVDISSPYMSVNCYRISKNGDYKKSSDETVAAVANSTISKFYILSQYPQEHIKWFDNYEDCLSAVRLGKAEAAYVDEFVLKEHYYTWNSGVLHAELCEFQFYSCFAYSTVLDKEIKNAFSRALMSIDTAEKEFILESNEVKSLNSAQRRSAINTIIIVAVITLLAVILMVIIYNATRVRMRESNKKLAANEFLIYNKQPEHKAPLPEPQAEPDISDIAEKSGADEGNPFSGKHALLAEDNELNSEIAAQLLEKAGIAVDCVKDGKAAVEKFSSSEDDFYDIIFMDVNMPVMNGLEATEAIRALERDDAGEIPIIALSGSSFEDDINKCLNSGMDAHISKPIDPDELYRALIENMA